jgi:hypothetical protein
MCAFAGNIESLIFGAQHIKLWFDVMISIPPPYYRQYPVIRSRRVSGLCFPEPAAFAADDPGMYTGARVRSGDNGADLDESRNAANSAWISDTLEWNCNCENQDNKYQQPEDGITNYPHKGTN